MQQKTTILKADGVTPGYGVIEECVIEFSEAGYTVLSDNRSIKAGYLHLCDESAPEITAACRDQIVKYMFSHPRGLPGLGKTPQKQYFAGLSTEDIERIGNDGRAAFYAVKSE